MEVSLEYMKIFEREQMLLEEGLSSELISRYLQMSVEEIEKIRYASDELS